MTNPISERKEETVTTDSKSEVAGAPACEIEITEEMIKAGVSVLYAIDYRFESHEDVAKEMLSVFARHVKTS